jgi:hypothetical protein
MPAPDPEETSIVPCTLEPDFVGRAKQRNQGKTRSLRPRQCAKLNNVTLGALMRTLLLPASLSLTLAGTAVLAHNDSSTMSRKVLAEYFEKCMNDWDATTHMTKKDWERTCRRLADQRVKFRLEHGFK